MTLLFWTIKRKPCITRVMSNEELVKLIQTGERNRLPDLWEQVRQMVYQQARRWAGVGGAETEDLIQAGFIALLSALDSYDSSAGAKFSTWFFQHIRREFANACGQRTERRKRDPLQGAVSLDAPLDDDESDGGTLGDIVPDPAAEAAIRDVDERDRLTRLRAVVGEVLAELPENLRKAIVSKYWHGEKVDSKTHSAALRQLRHPRMSKRLRECL